MGMRYKPKLFLAAVVIAVLVGILVAICNRQPVSAPKARLILLSYKIITMNPPDTNTFVFPGRGSWISATMLLTNEGSAAISYAAWGRYPYGWAHVETAQGKTNGYLAPPFTGLLALLRPEEAIYFPVTLPTNTLQWQCGFDVETASLRQRAITRVLKSRLYSRIPEICWYPVRFLSDKEGPSAKLRSQTFNITNQPSSKASN